MSLEKQEDDHPVETTATTHIDWLQLSIKAAQAASGLAEFVPFPYVQNVVETVVTLLETVEVCPTIYSSERRLTFLRHRK
jgi:hypothetical protein